MGYFLLEAVGRLVVVLFELLGGGRVDIDEDHGLVPQDFSTVDHVARSMPHVSGSDFRYFFPDGETHPAAHHEAELFPLMRVEGVRGAGLELGPILVACSCHPLPLRLSPDIDRREGHDSTSAQLNILPWLIRGLLF